MEYKCSVCVELEEIPPKKQILSPRSLGQSVAYYNSLGEAITLYMSRADENLHKQNSFTESILYILEQVHLNLTNLNIASG